MELPQSALVEIYRGIGELIGVLEADHGLSISIHTPFNFTNEFLNTAGWANIHRNEYCMTIKSDSLTAQKCKLFQRAVCGHFACSGCEDGYFGRCLFGVEEFVLPIRKDGTGRAVGFISVSGYSSDKEKTREVAERMFERIGFRPEGYDAALESLKSELPYADRLKKLLTPLADLLGLIDIRSLRHPETSDYSYRALCSYIDQHYDEPITVESAARLLGCSESYINHLFKKKSGSSIRGYINEVRVMHAKNLLRTSDKSIRDIALAVGFNDTNYFSSVFKRLIGSTPSEFRRELGYHHFS